ncbi:MAG: aldehyde dehydrogenase family protein, partial [bacterium]
MQTIPHLIQGVAHHGGTRTQPVYNPATGTAIRTLQLADAKTVELAIASAQAAYPAWRATPPLKRARVMSKLKELLEQNADKICALITEEHGKVLADAMGELQRGIE